MFFPVKIGDKIEVIKAYRVQHSQHKLPSKGGIRFALSVNLDEVMALVCIDDLQMRHCKCSVRRSKRRNKYRPKKIHAV